LSLLRRGCHRWGTGPPLCWLGYTVSRYLRLGDRWW
jgi:hypothetical protein